MTRPAAHPEILVSRSDDVLRITLNRPGHGNSLTPGLLTALGEALDQAGTARAVVLTGAGRSFSSGGDVAAIREHGDSAEALQTYCDQLVGGLNTIVLRLRELACPAIAAVNGPVTGGSLGLVLAADLTLMARSAFIQPYYAKMGFAPDGGWTALLPERIGRARTASWLALDTRIDADQALEMGLADRVVDDAGFDTALAGMLATLKLHDVSVIATSRKLLDGQTGAGTLAQRLDAERSAFLVQIARPETAARMARFLEPAPHCTASGGRA